MTSDLFLPLPQILLTQVKELLQNVLVMSPSKTVPWQLSYDTDSFVSIRHAFPCTGNEAPDTHLLFRSKNLKVDDVDVVIPVSLCSGGVHTA